MKRLIVYFLLSLFLFSACQLNEEVGSDMQSITTGSMTMETTDTQSVSTKDLDAENDEVYDVTKNYTLLIFGEEVQMNIPLSINVEDEYAELPLITIVEKAGGTVNWVSDNNVKIVLDGKKYVLKPQENSLREEDGLYNFQFLALPPGTTHGGYYQLYDREYVVDNDVLHEFLYTHGIRAEVNFQTSVVSVVRIDK